MANVAQKQANAVVLLVVSQGKFVAMVSVILVHAVTTQIPKYPVRLMRFVVTESVKAQTIVVVVLQ
jgi:hypothetical protein